MQQLIWPSGVTLPTPVTISRVPLPNPEQKMQDLFEGMFIAEPVPDAGWRSVKGDIKPC